MAKKQYTGTKLGITAAVAGLTMLTATWLAPSGQSAGEEVSLASPDTGYEAVEALATATPTTSSTTRSTSTAGTTSTTAAPTSTATASAASSSPSSTSSSTSKTSRAS